MKWFTQFPTAMFRLSTRRRTKLRVYSPSEPKKPYDVVLYNDLVQPTRDFTRYRGMYRYPFPCPFPSPFPLPSLLPYLPCPVYHLPCPVSRLCFLRRYNFPTPLWPS
jgi:hypothetical protein